MAPVCWLQSLLFQSDPVNTVLAGTISVTDEDRGANAKFGFLGFDCDAVSIYLQTLYPFLQLLSFDCDAVSICILLTRNIPIKSCSCMGNYWVLLCYLANMVLPILLQIVFWPMLLLVLDDAWEYKMWIFPVFVDLLSCTYLFALFRGIYLPALLHLEMTPVSSFVFFNAFVFVIL